MVRTETSLAEDNLKALWFIDLSASFVGRFWDSHVEDSNWLTVFKFSPKEDNTGGKGGTEGKELAKGVGMADELGL
jgi:hypothetical protein